MTATVIEPDTEDACIEAVTDAVSAGGRLRLFGGGTRAPVLDDDPDARGLSARRLSGILDYTPAEMTMTARAGTPMAEIEAALAERRQMLAFEPFDHRPMPGSRGEPTIGGVFSANVSGPRRLIAGAARDHLLGLAFVNGRGERIRAGGRVMKNVTGLDLPKLLAAVLPYPGRFRLALGAARLARPLSAALARFPALAPFSAMLAPAPAGPPAAPSEPVARSGTARGRVAMMRGCAEPVLDPGIQAAARRLLGRLGIEIVPAPGEGCCGALVHHMGREADALAFARRDVDAWTSLVDGQGLDAILVTASGCGTTPKDYGHMLRLDPAYARKAARISALARDVSEYLATLDLPRQPPNGITVAYHAACSLQHGQRIAAQPKRLLSNAGFTVRDPPEGHLCCGSAGTCNILQPVIAATLKARKVANIDRTRPDVIAAGNIGCITQIASATEIPVLHAVELLDWAHGGPRPEKLRQG